MAWAEQWSHKVDGTELNDRTNYFTQVPEVDNIPDFDIKSVPIDGTYPAFIRADPTSGIYTFLIQMTPCTNAVYDSRLASLGAIFTPAPHTYLFQIRGMATAKSVLIIPRGRVVNFKARSVVYTCFVPKPVPA